MYESDAKCQEIFCANCRRKTTCTSCVDLLYPSKIGYTILQQTSPETACKPLYNERNFTINEWNECYQASGYFVEIEVQNDSHSKVKNENFIRNFPLGMIVVRKTSIMYWCRSTTEKPMRVISRPTSEIKITLRRSTFKGCRKRIICPQWGHTASYVAHEANLVAPWRERIIFCGWSAEVGGGPQISDIPVAEKAMQHAKLFVYSESSIRFGT